MKDPFDPVAHKRIATAVNRMFGYAQATYPAAIGHEPGGASEYLQFDRQVTSWGWDFLRTADGSYHRADFTGPDGKNVFLIADGVPGRVIVYGDRDGKELLAELEEYVGRYAGAGADRC